VADVRSVAGSARRVIFATFGPFFETLRELASRNKISTAMLSHVAQHVIELAQTRVRDPTALYRLTMKQFKNKVRWVP
jgi:malonyl CoA-acyl carrier protein transacylase